MRDLSELNMLADVSDEDIRSLSAQVCVVPATQNKINVNTADALTLSILDPGISLADAQALTQRLETIKTWPNLYLRIQHF